MKMCAVCGKKPATLYSKGGRHKKVQRSTCGDRACKREARLHAQQYEWRPDLKIMRKTQRLGARRARLMALRETWFVGRV